MPLPSVAGLVQSLGSGAMTSSTKDLGDAACVFAIGTNTTADMEKAKHTHEMERQEFIVVNVDGKQMGVGGDDSWGARVHPQYTLEAKPYQYAFTLRPLAAEHE